MRRPSPLNATLFMPQACTLSRLPHRPLQRALMDVMPPVRPVRGHADNCLDANTNCQPSSCAAFGYFRSRASGNSTRATPRAKSRS
jgi:hypothetical protein